MTAFSCKALSDMLTGAMLFHTIIPRDIYRLGTSVGHSD